HSKQAQDDREFYQAVYASQPGSSAAPTAGLHFSNAILSSLKEKQIEILEVTLHVGAGTFLPVKTEELSDHPMHRENYSVSSETAQKLNLAKKEQRRIIAVGTTSLRTLES